MAAESMHQSDHRGGLRGYDRSWLAVMFVAASLGWAATGIFTVASNEVGIVTRFGKVRRNVSPGIHYAFPFPIERVYTPATTDVKRVEVGFKTKGELSTEPRRSDMLTGDENILKIMMVVQYKIRDPRAYLFQVDQPHWLIERAVESVLSSRVASLGVDEVLTSAKHKIQADTIREAQAMLDGYGVGVTLLGGNLQVVDTPVPVSNAFREVSSAKKDSERVIDEAHAYESRILPRANGQAQRMRSEAAGRAAERTAQAKGEANRFLSILAEYKQAEDVTKRRLFLESMERVFEQAETMVLGLDAGGAKARVTIVDR